MALTQLLWELVSHQLSLKKNKNTEKNYKNAYLKASEGYQNKKGSKPQKEIYRGA